MESIQEFLLAVNNTYVNFERDKELSERASMLNDIEFRKKNQEIKEKLDEISEFQSKLIDSIRKMNSDESSGHQVNLNELLDILNDNIEKKNRLEKELIEAKENAENANRIKSDFLSMISHEIRTPINAIIGLAYIMENENNIYSFRENIRVLNSSANNLNVLINDILDFNKIEIGKIDIEKIPINIKSLADELYIMNEIKAVEKENKFLIHFDENIPEFVIGDPLRISQILTNLISNACKFTKNGKVELFIHLIKIESENAYVQFRVSDTGIGIDKEKFDLIFEKFVQSDNQITRKYGGSGLGLAIVKMLLKLMNSEINLTSELGKGSEFSFELILPITKLNGEKKNVNHNELLDLEGLKILLVEDYPTNILVAKKILNSWNVEVEVANNGLEALEIFQPNKYHLILMDIQMPEMDGYECTEHIRKIDSQIPIIALTASSSMSNYEFALSKGMNDFILKPFNPTELYQKIMKYHKL